MTGKEPKPFEIIAKLGQVGVMRTHDLSMAEPMRPIGVTLGTFYR